ncbi:MAG: adenylate/guanylate cyclase domain-containing protein [Cyanobium sp. 49614_E6]|nr:adenylate/guanylate cyclase domain-containing protein [Cyanobium sp. 49614_E6]
MARSSPATGPHPKRILRQLAPYLAAIGLLLLLRQSQLSEQLNLLAYDLAVQLRPLPSGASTPVRIIGIDEDDLKRYGPMVADGLLADAIERLDRIGVRAIGLDLFCGQPVGAGGARLRRLAASNSRLVSVYFDLDGKRAIPGTPPHRQGYADLYTDPQDGLVRRDLLHVVGTDQASKASLPMRLLQIAKGHRQLPYKLKQHPQLADLGEGAGGYLPESPVTDDNYLQRMLAFHQPGSFPQWSLGRLLRNQLSPQQIQQLRGSIVLIGVVAPSSKDSFPVPFSRGRAGDQRFEIPGVEIHAHRLAALLALERGQSLGIQAASAPLNRWLLLLAIAVGIVAGERVPGLRRSFLLVASGLLLAVAATVALLALGVWLDAALPLAAFSLMVAAAWMRRGANQQIKGKLLEHQNRHVRSQFDRFVSKAVAGELLDNSKTNPFASEPRTVTVLMSDLRGFSLLGQDNPPALIVQLLNNYLDEMFQVIENYGGTIDEVLGDAILVLFGAPLVRADHAEAAVACALAMQIAMEKVNQTNVQQGLPALEMGIGLCTGDVIAGTIGSRQRAKYGVVGSAVNLAARIESLSVGGEVLAAEATVRAAEVPLRIDADHSIGVKGSQEPLRVFAIGAIQGRHNLALPLVSSKPRALQRPLTIGYAILMGKQRQGSAQPAVVTHLSEREAWIVLAGDQPELCEREAWILLEGGDQPELFDDLVLIFPTGSGSGEVYGNCEVYGKVREQRDGHRRVVFSLMSTGIKELIGVRGAA